MTEKAEHTAPRIDPADHTLDVRGLNCPLPVLKAKKAMRSYETGTVLDVLTTDPLAAIDIPAFCQNDGHALLEDEAMEGHHRYRIRKG